MSVSSYVSTFPAQKKSFNSKSEKWRIKCVDAGIKLINMDISGRRTSRKDKMRNYKLYNGHFDKSDMTYSLQPLKVEDMSFPAELQYRDIASPIFNLLFGEEAKRGLNFIIRAINEDAISEKETAKKDMILNTLYQTLSKPVEGEEEVKTPKQIEKYFTYEYQDMRESMASNMLNYLKRDLKLDMVFQKGWEDALLAAEELYDVDEVSNEPIAKRLNPLKTYYLLAPDSDIVDDSDVIVMEDYLPIGKIIDDYYEDLTPTQIDELENFNSDKNPLDQQFFRLPEKDYIRTQEELEGSGSGIGYLDNDGNIRVVNVRWKSRQKIGFRTYTDDDGEQQEDVVSEDYKVDKNNPEESVVWKWRNQYWEGTLIGDDIYINMGPRKQQFRRLDNLSICKSGVVGTVYNANNDQATSLMCRLVPWIYLHVTLWYRTELLVAANQGKIGLIDVSLIPNDMGMDKWLYYASVLKFGFVDSFNEGKKGQSTGKLAGNISTQNKVLDLETGAAIVSHIQLLDYVEEKLAEVSGVTKQRKGQIEQRELVGNVEKTIVQSSHITEKWFQIHNWTKQRVLEALVDVAKDVWSEDSKKFQYVADDMATVFFTLEGTEFVNSEFGVFVTNASKDQEALQGLKSLTQAALQNDKIAFSDVIDLYMNDSIADLKNKLKQSEANRTKDLQEQAQMLEQQKAKVEEDKRNIEKEKMDREDMNKQLDRESKERIALGQINSKVEDKDRDGIPDNIENDRKASEFDRKLALEERKRKDKKEIEEEKLKVQKKNVSKTKK